MQQPERYPPIEREIESPLASSAIFCDEIRREDNGKLILLGVYLDDLLVPKFPALLPGLSIAVVLSGPSEERPKSIGVRVYRDEELLLEIPASNEKNTVFVPKPPGALPPVPGVGQIFKARVFLRTPPLLLEKPCVLRVRVDTGKNVLRTGALQVLLAPSLESPDSEAIEQ